MEADKEDKVKVVFQYFNGCPHSGPMRKNVHDAISGFKGDIEYKEQLIKTIEEARLYKFRGSPTLLINSEDFENLPEPVDPAMSCRLYPGGLPTTEDILKKLNKISNKY
jgi:hypothetical protein